MHELLPSLAQQRIDDDAGTTILHVLCLNIHNVHDSYYIMRVLLQTNPEFASLALPSQDNDLPLHWLCNSNPKPSVLRLLLDAYPQAAATPNDDGVLPIHNFVDKCRCPESLQMLLDAAPGCMQHACAVGLFPLHSAISRLTHDGKIPEEYLVPLLKACNGDIVMDFCHRKSKAARLYCLGKLRDWALGGANGVHYGLVNEIRTLDIGGCQLGDKLVPLLCDLLPHCISMTVLDISDNRLSRDELQSVLPAVLRMPKLQRFNIDDNVCEAEDAAIILSMISAPHLDVSIRCRLDDTANEEFQGIAWQLDENECDDGDDSESHEQTEDDSQFHGESSGSDEDNDLRQGRDSDGSGWVTDEEVVADAVQIPQSSNAAPAGQAASDADIDLLQRLFCELECRLASGSDEPDHAVTNRCEGEYDSDQGDISISNICGDESECDSESDGRTEMCIDRHHLIESSLDALRHLTAKCALRDIDVNFAGERGIDQGGLTKAFLTMVILFDSALLSRLVLTIC